MIKVHIEMDCGFTVRHCTKSVSRTDKIIICLKLNPIFFLEFIDSLQIPKSQTHECKLKFVQLHTTPLIWLTLPFDCCKQKNGFLAEGNKQCVAEWSPVSFQCDLKNFSVTVTLSSPTIMRRLHLNKETFNPFKTSF